MDKVKTAIDRIREFEPPENYYFADSGGKDSTALRELIRLSGVKYDAHYSVTTIDPPDLVYFIRQYHPDTKFERPEIPFLKLLPVKGFPMRQSRWCCELYKENGGEGRFVLLGLRAEESPRRSRRPMVETCIKLNKRILNPIIDWTEQDVWSFIRDNHLPYCKLYDEGWKRIGCLFCPMQSYKHKLLEMARYPRYAQLFLKAFTALYDKRKSQNNPSVNRWKNGQDMFNWWIGGKK